ncbi:MAG: glycoside hydrolase family 2 TIM barrel-domain containing protein, partial [Lachnospiraceae bacterium]|nr:glycoside hydrolase family 2 TIM barrel-domain containing protein [Lachnospiraceae bacterium]
MKKLDFNHNWTVRPLSRAGEACPVTLPHDAMITEPRTADSMGEGNIGWFTGGDYEYKKKFTIPDELRDRKLILEFESVYKNAEVTINGKKAKTRPYGYTQFYIPLNEFLVDGENEITVIAHNSDQPNSRWYSGTGIYRPVWLWEGPKDYIPIRGVRVKTLTIRPKAVVLVTVKATAPGTACIEILKEGACVAKGEAVIGRTLEGCARIEVPNAELWSIENPSLYEVRVTLGGDVAADTFGIRTLTWTPEKGVALNGRHVILKGACIHHDNGVLGACTFPEAEDRRVRLLKKYGYNALRSAHNPASVWLLDACDKYGVLMMDEYVDAWYMHKTKYDYASEVLKNWKDDLAALVEKDYNHPSVIMYSTGNEVAESAQKKGIDLQTQFTSYLHSMDDTRPVSCGINIFFNFLSSVGLGVYSDDKADKLAEEAKKHADTSKPKKKAVGSEFYNMLAVKLGDNFMKLGATIPPCDWKTKGAYAAMDIAGYNYGLYRYKKDLKKYPDRLILGSET